MLKLGNSLGLNTQPIYRFQNNHSVDFDGVDGFIQLGEAISYTQHTISTWVKVSDSDDSKTIIDARDASDDGVRIRVDASENIIYELNTSDLTSTNTFAGEWVHIVATYDGTTQKLYINGSLDKSATTSQTISTTTNAEIGSRNFSDRANEFLGKIDELAIYDRALTAAEVTEIYRIKYGANLVQNGRFDELGSEILADGNFTNQEAVDFWSIATTGSESRATKSLQDGFMRLTYNLTNGSALFKSGIVTSGKSYRVTFRAKGTVTNNFGSIGDNANISSNPQYVVSNPNLTTSFQDYEFYVPVTSTTFRLYLNGSVTVGQTLDITNISIKQVDPNDRYALGTGWEINDSGLVYTGTTNANTEQAGILTSGKIYKLTYNVVTSTIDGVVKLMGETVSGTVNLEKSVGTHTQLITANGSNGTDFGIRITGNTTGTYIIDNLMIEQQKYVATNLKLNSLPYSSSNLRNYYRFGDGILDKHPLICDMVQPSLGSNYLTGTWDNGTGWTDIPNGVRATGNGNTRQNLEFTDFVGKVYKLTYTLSNVTDSTTLSGKFGGGSTQAIASTNGTHIEYLVNDATVDNFQLISGSNWAGDVTDISLQKINGVPGLMTNMTEADITNDVPS